MLHRKLCFRLARLDHIFQQQRANGFIDLTRGATRLLYQWILSVLYTKLLVEQDPALACAQADHDPRVQFPCNQQNSPRIQLMQFKVRATQLSKPTIMERTGHLSTLAQCQSRRSKASCHLLRARTHLICTPDPKHQRFPSIVTNQSGPRDDKGQFIKQWW